MIVVCKLSGPLRAYYRAVPVPEGEMAELAAGATVADLLALYTIPPARVHHLLVNRRLAALDTLLTDGDQVWAIPLAAGG